MNSIHYNKRIDKLGNEVEIDMIEIDSILKIVAGGFTGYITNTYAINMLFKAYTPLKLGGVIIKTREEFIEKISQLVEERLVNDETLQKHVDKESLKTVLRNSIDIFYTQNLPKNCKIQIQSLPKGKESIEALRENFSKDFYPKYYSSIEEGLKNKKIGQILDRDSIQNWTESIYEDIIKYLSTSSDLNLSISNEKIKKEIALAGLESIKDNKQSNDHQRIKIEEIITNHAKKPEIKSSIEKIKIAIQNQPLSNWIEEKEGQELLKRLSKMFKLYIESEKSEKWFNQLGKQLQTAIKENPKNIGTWIAEPYNEQLQSLIKEHLPIIIASIIKWVGKQQNTLEDMLQKSIDEVVEATKGERGPFIQPILASKAKNIVKDQALIEKIIEVLENKEGYESISEQITLKLIEYFNTHKLADIVEILDTEMGLNEEHWAKAVKWIISQASTQIEKIPIDKILNIKLGEILPDNIISIEKISQLLVRWSQDTLENKLLNYETWWTSDLEEKEIKSKLLKYLETDKSMKIGNLSEDIHQKLKMQKLDVLLKKIEKPIEKSVLQIAKEICTKTEETSIEEILEKLDIKTGWLNFKIENKANEGPEMLQKLLDGQVKKIVASNLNKLDEEELCELVHDFMGRELKPVTYFGAGLGALAGLGLAGISTDTWWLNMGIFGMVGYLTNVIALQMLFKPYESIKGFSKLPILKNFDQGYIVKNKAPFAKNLGMIVAREMLDEKSIVDHFKNHEKNIEEKLKEKIQSQFEIEKNNILDEKSEIVGVKLDKYLGKKIDDNKDKISIKILMEIKDYISTESGKLDLKNFEEKIFKELIENITDKLDRASNGSITKEFEIVLNEFWDVKIKEWTKNLSGIVTNYSQKFYLDKKENTITELIGEDTYLKFSEELGEKIQTWMSSEKANEYLNTHIQNYLDTLDDQKSLATIGQGKIKKFVDNKLDLVQKWIMEKAMQWLDENNEMIALKIDENIQSSLNFFAKMAYSSANGSKLVSDVVDHIIDIRLPVYIEQETIAIRQLIDSQIDENIWNKSIGQSRQLIEEKAIFESFLEFIEEPAHKETLLNGINSANKVMFKALGDIELQKYANLLGLDHQIYWDKIFKNNIQELIETANLENLDLSKAMTEISSEIIGIEITPQWISKQIIAQKTELIKSLSTKNYVQSLFEFSTKKNIEGNILDRIKTNKLDIKFEEEWKKEFDQLRLKAMDEGIKSWPRDIGIKEETIEEISERITKSAIETLETEIPSIVKIMELDQLTEAEVNNMSAKEIHELFNSFAKTYFRKLEGYGWLGAVFGLNQYVSILATGIYGIKNLFTKKIK